MSLSHLYLAAGQHLRKKQRTSFSDSAIALCTIRISPSSRVGVGLSFDQVPLKTVCAGLPTCGSCHSRWSSPAFIHKSCSSLPLFPRIHVLPLLHRAFYNRGKAFHFRQMTRPPLALPLSVLPMLPRHRPTMLRAYGVFTRRSFLVVPSSPLAVWVGCPSLLRSVRL
ncbi:conserved hypothetical protein [Ricinus communis]|uniref:Uncharacterized protein n=1 Tax=Ricinus communis TaxID=3988 RepID=B9RSA6_RICCO|nr:conserved hypothetical protein [Ricinus communis]